MLVITKKAYSVYCSIPNCSRSAGLIVVENCCYMCTKIYFYSDDLLLQEDLVQMVPMVNESNAMAEELDKKVTGRPFKFYALGLLSDTGKTMMSISCG